MRGSWLLAAILAAVLHFVSGELLFAERINPMTGSNPKQCGLTKSRPHNDRTVWKTTARTSIVVFKIHLYYSVCSVFK